MLEGLALLALVIGMLMRALAGTAHRADEPDSAQSSIVLSQSQLGNDLEAIQVTVTLRNAADHALQGHRVILRPGSIFLVGDEGRTDAQGRVQLRATIAPQARRQPTTSGAITLQLIDATADSVLPQQHIGIYNRVAVLLQGLGTALDCAGNACHEGTFNDLVQRILAPLGYTATGTAPTLLEYSYQGGAMAAVDGLWRWSPAAYARCATLEPVARSAERLQAMLLAYRARFPYTTFEIIGHSLGGLVALQALGDAGFLRRIGPRAIDKLVTIDSPVNGITEPHALAWLVDLFAGIWHLHACTGQGFGLPLVAELSGLGDAAPDRQHQWAAIMRAADIAVMNITNQHDVPVPERYTIIDDGQLTGVTDRLRYDLPPLQSLGHSAVLYANLLGPFANPSWSDFARTLTGYLQQPCLAFAPVRASCRYPTINRGF